MTIGENMTRFVDGRKARGNRRFARGDLPETHAQVVGEAVVRMKHHAQKREGTFSQRRKFKTKSHRVQPGHNLF